MHMRIITASFAVMALLASTAQAATLNVDQNNLKFSPNTLTVKAGDTVSYLNNDDVTHNINVIDAEGDPDDKGLQKPKQTITAKFDKPGEYQVRCAIHPKMKMTVTVQ